MVPAVRVIADDGTVVSQAVLVADNTEGGVWFTDTGGTSYYPRGSAELAEMATMAKVERWDVEEPCAPEFYLELALVAREMGR